MEKALPKLAKNIAVSDKELRRILFDARGRVEETALARFRDARFVSSAKERAKAYREIRAEYTDMAKALDGWLADLVKKNVRGRKGDAGFLRDQAEEYLALLVPKNAPSLVAIHASRMANQDLEAIRWIVTDSLRLSAVSDMTAKQVQKEMLRRLEDLVGKENLPSWRFIDKAGKRWKASSYFNMLNRTISSRIARETYLAALTKEGHDLVTIEGGGDPCPVCAVWRGRPVSITGKTKGYPTLDRATEAGVFHPNCVCEPRYIDKLLDEDVLKKWKGKKPPKAPSKEAFREYREAA